MTCRWKYSEPQTKWLAIVLPFAVAFASLGLFTPSDSAAAKSVKSWSGKRKWLHASSGWTVRERCHSPIFHTQYDKEQAQQYERIKELEKEIRQIEVMKQKIESLGESATGSQPALPAATGAKAMRTPLIWL